MSTPLRCRAAARVWRAASTVMQRTCAAASPGASAASGAGTHTTHSALLSIKSATQHAWYSVDVAAFNSQCLPV